MLKRIEIWVSGRVQGVFFRDFVAGEAQNLGLTGWTRNELNGIVSILVEGEEGSLKKIIESCKIGPKFAKVQRIRVEWKEATGEFTEFKIKY